MLLTFVSASLSGVCGTRRLVDDWYVTVFNTECSTQDKSVA